MKVIISSTFDSKYLYFLPITVWAWNRIGVDVVCFIPDITTKTQEEADRWFLAQDTILKFNGKESTYWFQAPEHKQATYAQCSRLYGACLDLPEDEVLITGDIDMAVFKVPPYNGGFTILGHDLVPKGQYPMCYASATVKDWRDTFNLNGISFQQALDRLLGDDECQDYRACRWSVDQEQLALNIDNNADFVSYCNRSNGQNQFAQNRVDRDDTNWRAYVNDDLIDAHLWRDGYTDQNHANIMELFRMKYPHDDFTWLDTYRNEYLKLL
jgi:hypothetical protein